MSKSYFKISSVFCLALSLSASACGGEEGGFPVFDGFVSDAGVDSQTTFDSARRDSSREASQDTAVNFDSSLETRNAAELYTLNENRAMAQDCRCNYPYLNYTTEAACYSARELKGDATTCNALAADTFPGGSVYLYCLAAAADQLAGCRASAGCSVGQFARCKNEYDSARMGCAEATTTEQIMGFESSYARCVNGPLNPVCESVTLVDGRATLNVDTTFAGDDYQSYCAATSAADRAFAVTAPGNGKLRVQATNDSIVALVAYAACDPLSAGLACSTNEAAANASFEITVRAGQSYTVVADSPTLADTGLVALQFEFLPDDFCDPVGTPDVGGTVSFTGNTSTAQDSYGSPICGGFTGRDTTHAWRPSQSGYYRLALSNDAFSSILAVRRSCTVDDADFVCDTNSAEDPRSPNVARVDVRAVQGETLVAVVDGNNASQSGSYTLTINKLPDDLCPAETLPSSTAVSRQGNTIGALNDFASCGMGAGPDVAYAFTAPEEGDYRFYFASADFSPSISIRESCDPSSSELGCGAGPNPETVSVTRRLSANEPVIVVIDSAGSSAFGTFDLRIEKLP